MDGIKRIRILDVPVDMVNYQQALDRFEEMMQRDGCELIVTPNSEIVVNAGEDPELKDLIEKASLVIPDGIGIVYASRYLGVPLEERVTGVDFLTKILEWLAINQKSIFLLGSKPENEERAAVAELAAESMKEKFHNLIVAGTHHGYFKKEDEAEIVKKINESGADFLCVALGSPKQEKFIMDHRDEFKNIKAAIGVGGSLDVWAGTVRRAPEFYQKHGIEWLYRLKQEPSRFGRIMKLPVFMIRVVLAGKKNI